VWGFYASVCDYLTYAQLRQNPRNSALLRPEVKWTRKRENATIMNRCGGPAMRKVAVVRTTKTEKSKNPNLSIKSQ